LNSCTFWKHSTFAILSLCEPFGSLDQPEVSAAAAILPCKGYGKPMFDDVKVFDISPEVSEGIAVFPGDTPYRRKVALDFSKGDNLVLSAIETTVHAGAHTDAPNHYHERGTGIETRDLSFYMGECQVVSVKIPRGERIQPKDLVDVKIKARRVLFKTGSFPDPNQWSGDFNSLSPQLIELLAGKGVVLVGIDTPSIDPEQDKALESHQAIYKKDLAILEGLVLDQVPDGLYTLIALPLKLKGADASPVRAVLVCKK
jgi:arylformamidase